MLIIAEAALPGILYVMSFGLDRIAERKIADAVEQGQFENLEGKGRPLNLDEDAMTPPHLRLGNRILRNANLLPDWVQMDVDIRKLRTECARMQALFRQNYTEQQRRATDSCSTYAQMRFATWYARNRTAYFQALKSHNDAVLKFNIAAPNSPTIHIPFHIREEMERIERSCPAPPDFEGMPDSSTSDGSGMLRDSITALYRAGLSKGS